MNMAGARCVDSIPVSVGSYVSIAWREGNKTIAAEECVLRVLLPMETGRIVP